jgi:hypothetical protein
MNGGGAGLLEQDARWRGGAELEHAGHQQLQAFFAFENLLVPVGPL